MPTLESQIDDLYKRPLDAFVASRTALAKTLDKEDAKRVKALPKPTVVPWAANQVYWHARDDFDRLLKTGQKLRDAQVVALSGGKSADIRSATEAHRAALATALMSAVKLAAAAGVHPNADELSRTLEALSMARETGEPHGRLTRPLTPAGFEALAGVDVKPGSPWRALETTLADRQTHRETKEPAKPPGSKAQAAKAAALERARLAEERAREAEEKKRLAAIARAEAALASARDEEAEAKGAWQKARDRVVEAEQKLAALERER
ncbi:MAG TPA: hypothetical protein VJP86_17850 [Vicinamibacterales bacterium]|nr:hypothetical protein [Vicinamibacterales bacterium]